MRRAAQIALVLLGSCGFGTVVIIAARRRLLSIRYMVGWLFVVACLAVGGMFSGLITPIARALNVDPGTMVFAITTLAILLVALQLSITASGLTESVRSLAEANALLEERVRRLESCETLTQDIGPSETENAAAG
jgi:hypothetical protein